MRRGRNALPREAGGFDIDLVSSEDNDDDVVVVEPRCERPQKVAFLFLVLSAVLLVLARTGRRSRARPRMIRTRATTPVNPCEVEVRICLPLLRHQPSSSHLQSKLLLKHQLSRRLQLLLRQGNLQLSRLLQRHCQLLLRLLCPS
jgi:hypothetical protein